jgi:hypothetical protein
MPIPTDLKIILDTAAAEHMENRPNESVLCKGERLQKIRDDLKTSIDNWYRQNPDTEFDFNGHTYPSLLAPSSPNKPPRRVVVGYLQDCLEAVNEGHEALRDARRYCRRNNLQAPYWLTENREVPVSASDYQRFIQKHCVYRVQTPAEALTQREINILTSLRPTANPYRSSSQRFLHHPY